jgi:thiazole synthase ThiGH ThiG subunit
VIGVVSDLLESVEVETGAVVVPTSVAVALDAAISAMSVWLAIATFTLRARPSRVIR